MPKSVLIISTSPRKNSNSDALAEAFAEGARAAGHVVKKVSLRDKTLNFCKGCLSCQKTLRCVQQDDAWTIVQDMCHADVVCFATPVYYYAVCGQLKTLLDRANPLFPADYAFRDVYLLASAAEDDPKPWTERSVILRGGLPVFPRAALRALCAAQA